MKQLFAAILCLCLLAGCGRTDSTGNTCRAEDEPTVGAEKAEPIGESFRIIQEKPDWLLLAKEEGDSAEVYTLSLSDTELTLDGEVFERNEPGAYQRFPALSCFCPNICKGSRQPYRFSYPLRQ